VEYDDGDDEVFELSGGGGGGKYDEFDVSLSKLDNEHLQQQQQQHQQQQYRPPPPVIESYYTARLLL